MRGSRSGRIFFGVGSFGDAIDFLEEVDHVHALGGGVVVAECHDGGGLEDHAFHDSALDATVIAVEAIEHGLDVAAEDAHPDSRFAEVLGDFHFVHGDQLPGPFVIALQHGADFAPQQFVDSILTLGHGWWEKIG